MLLFYEQIITGTESIYFPWYIKYELIRERDVKRPIYTKQMSMGNCNMFNTYVCTLVINSYLITINIAINIEINICN